MDQPALAVVVPFYLVYFLFTVNRFSDQIRMQTEVFLDFRNIFNVPVLFCDAV